MIKILSLMPPWSWLMTHGIEGVPMKDVENRKWATSYRGPVLVHASKNWDAETFGFYAMPKQRWSDDTNRPGTLFEVPSFIPAEIKKVMPKYASSYKRGGVVGMFTITDCVIVSKSPWFFGPKGFLVKDQKPLPFTPWKGQLGLRDAPAELLALLELDENGKEVQA